VAQQLFNAGFYADVDLTDKKFIQKIPKAQLAQYNYILVVGEMEKESGSVNIRTRDNTQHGAQKLEDFIQELKHVAANYQ